MVKKENTSEDVLENKIGIGKFWAWNSRTISVSINALIMGYVVFFCTDTLRLSPIVVGAILMVSRCIDAFTDLFAGFFVDRTSTKLGKGRPFEFCVIGLWLCTILLYSCPDSLSTMIKYIWIFVTYFFVQSVFNTLLGASDIVYLVRAFKNQEQYAKLNSLSGILISIAGLLFNVSFPILMAKLAVSPAGWRILIAIYAIPCAVLGMFRFIFVKEVNDVDGNSSADKIKLKDVGILLKTNKYIYPIGLAVFLVSFLANMGVAVYYYTYILENISLMSLGAIVSMLTVPVLFVFPKLVQKMPIKQIMIYGAFIGAVGYFIQFLANKNFIVLMIGSMIGGLGMLPFSYLVSLLVIDCATFNEWKKRPRMEGTLNTVVAIAKKGGAAFGAGFAGLLLGLAGYDKSLAIMPDSALFMIRVLMGLIPAICYLLTIVCLRIYKLDKLMPQIRKDLEEVKE